MVSEAQKHRGIYYVRGILPKKKGKRLSVSPEHSPEGHKEWSIYEKRKMETDFFKQIVIQL